MGKPDKKKQDKQGRLSTGKYRIWPGVTCITLVVAALFVWVYLSAYRAGIIPLPELLAELLTSEGERPSESVVLGEEDISYSPPDAVSAERYRPEEMGAAEVFASLATPEKYHQRFRIRRVTAAGVTDRSYSLYADGSRWLLRASDTASGREAGSLVESLYICDGESLYRSRPHPSVSAVGDFTPSVIVGLPTLEQLRESGAVVELHSADKTLSVKLALEDGLMWQGQIALDTGLFMELELLRDGVSVLSMYTELFDLTPRAMEAADFWTFPADVE